MQSLMRELPPEFTFAGFTFPRYVGMLPRGSLAQRAKAAKNPVCGPYFHAPKPNSAGKSFYLDSDFMPQLRWRWCDDIAHSIRHTGWYCDAVADDSIRGLVMTLPHGRGFLAGWSMGQGMASYMATDFVYDDEVSAAFAADSFAQRVAEDHRDAALAELEARDDHED